MSTRLNKAKADLAEALIELIEAKIEAGMAQNDWIDQAHSPLGRRRHLSLAKCGKLPAVKDGRKVMVRRADIEAYLAGCTVVPVDSEVAEDQAATEIASRIQNAKDRRRERNKR